MTRAMLIVEECRRLGIELAVHPSGKTIGYRPANRVPDDLRRRIVAAKGELLAWLTQKPAPDSDPSDLGELVETSAGYLVPARLPAAWRERFEERAAIREYDGGETREHAEAGALAETVRAMRRAGELPADKNSGAGA